MSHIGLAYHSGYTHVDLALAYEQNIVDTYSVPKHQASRDLLIATDLLLSRNSLSLSCCSFLAGHVGRRPLPRCAFRYRRSMALPTQQGCHWWVLMD